MKASTSDERTLLIVEDDDDCREMLKQVIQMQFPEIVVHTAFNGRAGLEQFRKYTPRVVVTDINMPELNGLQMAEQIAQLKPETRLIVVTADADKAELLRSTGTRFNTEEYILKPVRYQELFQAIERCLQDPAHRSGGDAPR